VATEKGWWAKVGLKPTFSTFPAGVPQIAASASGSWDVGGLGSVPAVLGAARYHLLTIGLTNDESAGNALMATKDKAAGFEKNPASIKGQTIALTANSTGDYAVQKCLGKWGMKKSDVTMKSMGQAEVISAMSSNNAELGGLWAPNIYTLEEKAGARVICSGREAGVVIPGALVARADYAKDHPQEVAKYLAVYLHAWKWIQAHRKESIDMMKKFYEIGGVTITEASMQKEFDTRPVYDLEQHLKIMDRSHGASKVDDWMTQISEFLKGVGTIQQVQPASEYVTDRYMKMIAQDPKLKAFAESAD
jgi:NitT/TauT family transport system substrate-binding protein